MIRRSTACNWKAMKTVGTLSPLVPSGLTSTVCGYRSAPGCPVPGTTKRTGRLEVVRVQCRMTATRLPD